MQTEDGPDLKGIAMVLLSDHPVLPRATSSLALVLAVGAMITGRVNGQCEVAKLLAPDGMFGDKFGWTVGIRGDVAVIGAPSNGIFAAGSAYIFRYGGAAGTWNHETKLIGSDTVLGDLFGYPVNIHDDVVIVGAMKNDDNGPNSGSAYIFRYVPDLGLPARSLWIQEAKLLPSDGDPGDHFGGAVAVSGDVAIVGAHRDVFPWEWAGSAYIFCRVGNDWLEQAKLSGFPAGQDDFFGLSVAVQGGVAFVGAPGDDDNGHNSGSAYVFRYNPGSSVPWQLEAKLQPQDAEAQQAFGWSLAISGDVLIVGAAREDDDRGSAYIFRFDPDTSEWIQEAKLLDRDGALGDFFGHTVAMEGDVVTVGAHLDDDGGLGSGSAHQFRRLDGEWVQTAKLTASDAAYDDNFGRSVAISGSNLLVGASRADNDGVDTGAAYVFDILDPIPGDLDDDGDVDLVDVLLLIAVWGPCNDCNNCPADLDRDCTVGVPDLLTLLANWG